MDEAVAKQYLTSTFDGVETLDAHGYTFFFYDPERRLAPERRFPFVTIACQGNEHEHVSNLNRRGVYRLNIGVTKERYARLFGPRPAAPGPSGVVETGHDFTALDQILPHPHYAPQSWICILSPSDATWEAIVRPLLAEAYNLAVKKYEKSSH
jgi:hypothetical protein